MENVLSFTPVNFITVGLMVALMAAVLYMGLRYFNKTVSEKSNA